MFLIKSRCRTPSDGERANSDGAQRFVAYLPPKILFQKDFFLGAGFGAGAGAGAAGAGVATFFGEAAFLAGAAFFTGAFLAAGFFADVLISLLCWVYLL